MPLPLSFACKMCYNKENKDKVRVFAMELATFSALLEKIKKDDRIVIMRHKRPDGDAVGSTLGLRAILRASFPEKDVRVINDDYAARVAFLGEEDGAVEPAFYTDALGIVVDTANRERISNPCWQICRELVKLDHHPNVEPYGDLMVVEDTRSAASELVAAFAVACELTIDKEAATCLYAGIVDDSGRFRFESVSPETLRLAATLLALGVDTEWMFEQLYLGSFEALKFRAWVLENIQRSPAGVLYLTVTLDTIARFGITQEEASASVVEMSGIKGSPVWLVCIENADGSARVRLRSRHIVINTLAERYGGGGHKFASGSSLPSVRDLHRMVAECDALVWEYQEGV